jgi:hypothetical protein
MRYLLVVGFACEVYRKEPRARIYINNQLIDEFYIQHHKDTFTTAAKKSWGDTHILQPYSYTERENIKINCLPPVRFYEIEIDQKQNQAELYIEIKNDDSNYNNGFMTNSTLLQLQACYFFPLDKKIISRLFEIRKKNFIKKNYAWYRSNKNIIFRPNENDMQWQGENTQTFKFTDVSNLNKIGGNGHFICKFVKKYGIFISKLSRSYRYRFFETTFIDGIINKYNEYVNQRNSN